jgi:hypothetical protein
VPYCPVRPQQFGFYGTQWRRWPGQEIVQVAAERDVAPVAPPRSAVPGPAEESINPQGDSDAAGDTGGGDSAASLAPPGEAPPEPRPLDPAPNAPPQPESVPEPIPEPAFEPAMEFGPEPAAPSPDPTARPAAEAQPDATEPVRPEPEKKPRPEDENLFEVLSGWRARRKFAVGPAGGSPVATVAADREGPRQAGHVEQPTVREVPRVPFDPAAETRRLRNAR